MFIDNLKLKSGPRLIDVFDMSIYLYSKMKFQILILTFWSTKTVTNFIPP